VSGSQHCADEIVVVRSVGGVYLTDRRICVTVQQVDASNAGGGHKRPPGAVLLLGFIGDFNCRSMALRMTFWSTATSGANRATTLPLREMRNFSKFQRSSPWAGAFER
jgi:hypothetical protein